MRKLYVLCIMFLTAMTLSAQIIDIPDARFKQMLVSGGFVDNDGDGQANNSADINNDDEIDINEALAVTMMDVGIPTGAPWTKIQSLEGIQYFTNLVSLNVSNNDLSAIDTSGLTNLMSLECHLNDITSLDLTNLTLLETLKCLGNPLGTIDLSALVNLKDLSIGACQLTSLDLSNQTNLEYLDYYNNQLPSLDLSNQTNLLRLNCNNNGVTSLDFISGLSQLEVLKCNQNQITSIDLTQNLNLKELDCGNNQLTELDVSQLSQLYQLSFRNNSLTSFDSNGTRLGFIEGENNELSIVNLKDGLSGGYISYFVEYVIQYYFSNNPIEVMCVDDFGYEAAYLSQYNTTTYCSFVPGGEYYTIEGQTRFDGNNNGCDTSDFALPYLTYSISNDSSDGNILANGLGEYAFYVADESYTFAPVIENASYFNISPESQIVSFPSDTSPFQQDFCITPNGIHNDLEVTLIPLDEARPGFDADYKLLYKNNGTTVLSGSVALTFQDEIMDLVSALPNEDSQSVNTLSWNFNDLTPFETREILLTMNINTPTETPPVNGDDVLVFDASVSTSETDETPDDNSFTLNQTVVNSFDPNDKTCLEGDIISPDMVGDFVHYRIRFENTGTANAINVVVKDNIDRTKFDLSTLVPVDASHDFIARIQDNTDDYFVEFIFENIDLPFDDANNDGYVVFKIKTLDTLVLNDTFENEAEIYFDFNFPIITNTAQTTVSTLSTDDFEFADNAITLFPNPAQNTLYLKSELAIKDLIIYDIAGRRIQELTILGSETIVEIDTKALQAGTYFIEIKTETSQTVRAFIKN